MANKWRNNGTVRDFIFLGFKITDDGDYNHETKRHFLLGRKAMTNPASILKSWEQQADSQDFHLSDPGSDNHQVLGAGPGGGHSCIHFGWVRFEVLFRPARGNGQCSFACAGLVHRKRALPGRCIFESLLKKSLHHNDQKEESREPQRDPGDTAI